MIGNGDGRGRCDQGAGGPGLEFPQNAEVASGSLVFTSKGRV